jgi:two-component system, NarL family, response regulator DevR
VPPHSRPASGGIQGDFRRSRVTKVLVSTNGRAVALPREAFKQMKRILLVEDHKLFRDCLAYCLDREPDLEVVAQANSLAETRNLGRSDGFDVAVVDLSISNGDGTNLIRELQDTHHYVPVMVLTVSIDPTEHARTREAGAEEVLNKATTLEEVTGTVRNLSNRREPTLAGPLV